MKYKICKIFFQKRLKFDFLRNSSKSQITVVGKNAYNFNFTPTTLKFNTIDSS